MDRIRELRKYAEERVAEYAQNSAGASHPDEKATWRARHIAWQRVLSIYDFIEVVQSVLKGRGRNPVRLTNHRLRELGISRETKQYQLRRLEAAGVIKIETQQRKGTVVTHLWFPEQR